MTDSIHIEHGCPPWQPTEGTVRGAVYHQYSIPLVGVVVQEGVRFLYWCVTGHAAPENAWAYARINEEDERALATAGHENFDEALRKAVGDRVCTFAIASDEKGVIEWVVLQPPATFEETHRRGMVEMAERFQEVMAEYSQLQERFPALRSAAGFNLAPSPRPVEV